MPGTGLRPVDPFPPSISSTTLRRGCPHFTDVETKVQRCSVPCPSSRGKVAALTSGSWPGTTREPWGYWRWPGIFLVTMNSGTGHQHWARPLCSHDVSRPTQDLSWSYLTTDKIGILSQSQKGPNIPHPPTTLPGT